MIEIDGVVLGFRRFGDQRICLRLVEAESALDDGMQCRAFYLGDVAVDCGCVHEQSGRRQAIIIVLEMRGLLAPLRHLDEEFAKAFEHRPTRTPEDGRQT